MKRFSFVRAIEPISSFSVSLLAVLILLSGCAHRYLMTFTDGNHVISISKPKLEGVNYHFTDEAGVACVIPKDRVAKIATGSVDKKQPPQLTPAATPAPPKKNKHWYFLWLA